MIGLDLNVTAKSAVVQITNTKQLQLSESNVRFDKSSLRFFIVNFVQLELYLELHLEFFLFFDRQ